MNIWLFATIAVFVTVFAVLNYIDSKESIDLLLILFVAGIFLQGLEVYGLREKIRKLEESRQSKVADT